MYMWNLEVLIGGNFLYPSWQTNLLAAGFWDSILQLIKFKTFFPHKSQTRAVDDDQRSHYRTTQHDDDDDDNHHC